MFIANERRLSRSGSRRQSRWDVEARPPRNWRKALRLTLYTLLGLLGSLAALASVSLMLQRHRSVPVPAPAPLADAALPALPAAPAPVPAAPAAPAPPSSSDGPALRALQDQMRDAATVLADLRRQADQLRQGIADVARARAAADEAADKARQAQQAVERDRAAQAEQAKTEVDWADAERTVRTLAPRPPPAPPPARPAATAQPAQPPQAAPAALADATPAPAPQPRPRVALRYQSGSAAAMQAANDIAQRLLFSDFTYIDTRSAPDAPASPVIRYFHQEDAAAAQRLADWLSNGGARFRVQDASAHAGRAPPVGTLDVWIGG
jgi:hypothetical protein